MKSLMSLHGGSRVFLASPTAEDLTAMGTNLMDSTRRKIVLDTSLRTSPHTWSEQLVG